MSEIVAFTRAQFAALDSLLSSILSRISDLEEALSSGISEAVGDWLDAHPEATTTVEDGSVTKAKLASSMYDEISAADVAAMF